MNKNNPLLITCAKGIGPFLASELKVLGFPVLKKTAAGIETKGSFSDTMQLNLYLRTAHRVLFLLENFQAEDSEDLYRETIKIPWEKYIPQDGYVTVVSSVLNPTIRDSRFANVRCKDAIVDRIRKKTGARPDSGSRTDKAVIYLYWKNESVSVYLDTSGVPLARRGYRKIPMSAPMQETLAAAVVLASDYQGEGSFINPMCGSGTIAIEAALIALHKAPGLLRSNFGFKHILGFEPELWKEMRIKARNSAFRSLPQKILATDIDKKAVSAAGKNAMTAGVDQFIDFKVCDFRHTDIPEGKGKIILNPPYGERMGEKKKLEKVYRSIGDFFKHECQGYQGYIFTGNPALAKKVGLKASKRIPFYSGPLDCRLLEYELYPGTKRFPAA